MPRQDIERQKRLEPIRMQKAIESIEALGYEVKQIGESQIQFKYPNDFSGKIVRYYPYSGWARGANIKDGRGLNELLRQIKN